MSIKAGSCAQIETKYTSNATTKENLQNFNHDYHIMTYVIREVRYKSDTMYGRIHIFSPQQQQQQPNEDRNFERRKSTTEKLQKYRKNLE